MPAIGEIFTATVRDIGSSGQGIVEHPDGLVLFVSGVWHGELGEFRISGLKGRHGYAQLERLIETSPQRVEPACHFQGVDQKSCGGCPWMFVDYKAQLDQKQQRVESALASLNSETIHNIWASPETFAYRNRAQLKSNGRVLGFLAESSEILVDIDDCKVLNQKTNHLLETLRATLPNKKFRPARKYPWVTIDIDDEMDNQEITINKRRPFRQANSAQNLRMRDWLATQLNKLEHNMSVIELFCGSGNFTEVIAQAGFHRVLAVEGVREALISLENKCLPGVIPYQANLFTKDALRGVLKQANKAKVLVLDPPREGLKSKEGFSELGQSIQHIFYISCDLATFARDASFFCNDGFELIEVQPVDQFPHTPHIETLAWFKRC